MGGRLIDADALMDALNVFKDRKNGNEHFMYGIETAKELLGIQPTVDAVQVVRCGKCKYFVKNTCECVRLADRFGDEYSDAMVYPEYYCADGERRTE